MAYRHLNDQLLAMTGGFLGYPCANQIEQRGITVLESTQFENCYRLAAPQRFRGVWIDEFEGSRFLDGATQAPNILRYDRGPRTWLAIEKLPAGVADRHNDKRRAYRVDLIGRKTLFAGHYGHAGASTDEILADKIISIRAVAAPMHTEFCNAKGKCEIED